jgi:hypothetical protein
MPGCDMSESETNTCEGRRGLRRLCSGQSASTYFVYPGPPCRVVRSNLSHHTSKSARARPSQSPNVKLQSQYLVIYTFH